MPPKPKGKATTKKSAEEPKVEAEIILPDGARTLFVGGWSTLQSIYKGIASLKPCERLVVLPGIYSWEGEEALEVPSGTEIYAVPNLQKASEAADSSDPSGDERTRSDCDAAAETVECAPSAPVHEEVLFTGSWKLTSKKPTNPPASTEIPPASIQIKAQHHNAAEKEKSGAGSVTATSRPDDASPRDPQPGSTTRTPRVEKDAALIQASVFPSVTPVDPSTWESVKISRVTFEGFVTVSALHATFTSCVFRALEQPCEASHCKALLTVYHYCKVKVFESLFLGIKHVGLALLPLSEVTAQRCTFTSDLDGELQCPSDSMTLASGKSAQNDMQAEQEVQDDDEEEEEKVSLTKKENSTTRLVSPTRVRRPGQRLNTSPLETQQEVAVLFQHCGPCTIVHSTFHHLYCAMMALGSPHAVFEGNTIHHIRNTALLLDHNAQCKVQKNNVKKCQFYALQSIPVQGADTGNPVASQECHNNTKLKKKKTQVQDDSNEGEHDETSSAVTELVKQPARVFGNQFYGMGRVARGSRVIIRDTLFTEGLRYDGEEEEPYLEPTY